MTTQTVERGAILQIGHTKGGATKSTTTTNLAAALAQTGASVVIIDADKQRTCANWQQRREDARERGEDLPNIACIEKLGNIKSTALEMAQHYDVVLIDSAGRDSQELRIGLMTADTVLIPFQASQADLESLDDLEQILTDTHDYNPGRKILAFLANLPTHHLSQSGNRAQQFLSDVDLTLLDTRVHHREAYKDALAMGRGVTETGKNKAGTEITQLLEEIISHAG